MCPPRSVPVDLSADLHLWAYPLLAAVGLVAGLVDAVAGGGGVLTMPVLLNLGFPVPLALGTNKLQASFGSVSAAVHYVRGGVVSFRACLPGATVTFLASLTGAWTVQRVDSALLGDVIPWLLAVILVYTVVKPRVGEHPGRELLPAGAFFLAAGLLLGFYDGFFGPGVGSFWTIALVALMGRTLVRATGETKVMNAASNLAALLGFALGGQIALGVGLVMGAGQVVGARIGARLVMTRGARFVKPVFVTMVAAVLARLLWVRFG
jgi:uncharacterized protein